MKPTQRQFVVIVACVFMTACVLDIQGHINRLNINMQNATFARGIFVIKNIQSAASKFAMHNSDSFHDATTHVNESETLTQRSINNQQTKTNNHSKGDIRLTSLDRICSQKERLCQMKKVCDSYNDLVIHTLASEYIVDDKHQLVLGFIHEGGGTSLRMLLVEASGYKIVKNKAIKRDNSAEDGHDLQYLLHNWKHSGELNDREAIRVFSKYFTTMLFRHPFDRLLSAYRCKIAVGSEYSRSLVKDILVMFNQDIFRKNKTLASLELQQRVLGPPSFLQFLTWLKETKTPNRHWMSIADTLHPCAVDWSAIMRVETINHDDKLVLDKLRPDVDYDRIPVRHSHQNTTEIADHISKHLPEYEAIPTDIIEYYLDMYRVDMEMFGYRWNSAKNVASCSIKTENGQCC